MTFHVEPALEATLRGYAATLRASPHNLLSPSALAALEERHLPESLALAALLPPGPARLVDVGSGGGLPGLVIAAARADLEVTLVEATGKKAEFLRTTARDLAVPVTVVHGRIEALVADGRVGGCDLATARAVAPLARLVPWVVPALRPGGLLYAVKGERWHEELEAARDAIARAGARVVSVPDTSRPTRSAAAPPTDPDTSRPTDPGGACVGARPLLVTIERAAGDPTVAPTVRG